VDVRDVLRPAHELRRDQLQPDSHADYIFEQGQVALMAVKAHRIVIEPTSIRGERGQYYRVYFEGAVLIEDTWNPEFEACRALVAQGVTGRLEVWRADKPGLIFPDVEEGARWTVEENDKVGPRIIPWEPFPDRPQPDAVSCSGESATAAENCPDGVTVH
jgi:hypothetical protein